MSTRQSKGNQNRSQTPAKEEFDSKPAATEAAEVVKEAKPSIDPDFIRAIFAEQLEQFFATKGPGLHSPQITGSADAVSDSEIDLNAYLAQNGPPPEIRKV